MPHCLKAVISSSVILHFKSIAPVKDLPSGRGRHSPEEHKPQLLEMNTGKQETSALVLKTSRNGRWEVYCLKESRPLGPLGRGRPLSSRMRWRLDLFVRVCCPRCPSGAAGLQRRGGPQERRSQHADAPCRQIRAPPVRRSSDYLFTLQTPDWSEFLSKTFSTTDAPNR